MELQGAALSTAGAGQRRARPWPACSGHARRPRASLDTDSNPRRAAITDNRTENIYTRAGMRTPMASRRWQDAGPSVSPDASPSRRRYGTGRSCPAQHPNSAITNASACRKVFARYKVSRSLFVRDHESWCPADLGPCLVGTIRQVGWHDYHSRALASKAHPGSKSPSPLPRASNRGWGARGPGGFESMCRTSAALSLTAENATLRGYKFSEPRTGAPRWTQALEGPGPLPESAATMKRVGVALAFVLLALGQVHASFEVSVPGVPPGSALALVSRTC